MNFSYLAVDLDGTLLRNDHAMSDFSARTLLAAQERGMKVIVCTGRPTDGTRHIADQLQLRRFGGYVIAYNGAEIIDCATGQVVRDLLVPEQVLPQALAFARQADADLITFCDGRIVSTSASNPFVVRSSVRNRMRIAATDRWLDEVEGLRLHKCMLVGTPDRLIAMEPKVKAAFEGVVEAFCSEPQFLEITPLGVNKGAGLQWLLSHAGIDPHTVIAFGDTPSDIPMIRLAGMGVAMANAPERVKAAADAVALSNEEDGVACLLEKMMV